MFITARLGGVGGCSSSAAKQEREATEKCVMGDQTSTEGTGGTLGPRTQG